MAGKQDSGMGFLGALIGAAGGMMGGGGDAGKVLGGETNFMADPALDSYSRLLKGRNSFWS